MECNIDTYDKVGILLFGFIRPDLIKNTLMSLDKQNALGLTHVWIDGNHGNPNLFCGTKKVYEVVKSFNVKKIHRHNGHLGFRKLMIDALFYMSNYYKYIIILEDDCFPVSDAIQIFLEELKIIENMKNVFSVYGHHFLVPNENDYISRFQGWGWATTSEKLKPILDDLYQCFKMNEAEYLRFVKECLSDEIIKTIDVTPGRQPSRTLNKFFAWDETICLLCALKGLVHKKSKKRIIYNCGVGKNSTHFKNVDIFRKPPHNMIEPSEVWKIFNNENYVYRAPILNVAYYGLRIKISKLKLHFLRRVAK